MQNKAFENLTITERKFLRVANLKGVANLKRVANLSKVGNPERKVGNPETNLPKVGNPEEITFSQLIEQTFKRFFQSYALAFNKQHNRKGNLFYKPFKRVRIKKDAQFTVALIYIHVNAGKHGLVKNFASHKWSSWHTITSESPTSLLRDEVINWFGNLEECIKAHNELAKTYYDCEIAIED